MAKTIDDITPGDIERLAGKVTTQLAETWELDHICRALISSKYALGNRISNLEGRNHRAFELAIGVQEGLITYRDAVERLREYSEDCTC